jgi:hypothetical protein
MTVKIMGMISKSEESTTFGPGRIDVYVCLYDETGGRRYVMVVFFDEKV